MKTVFLITGYVLVGVSALVILYFLVAFALARMRVPGEPVPEEQQEISIYILHNGVHTDLVVPLKSDVYDWLHYVNYRHTKGQDASARFVAFGWGDKGFYLDTPTWADLKASTAFKAMTGLGASAIHATFYRNMQENAACRRLGLSKEQYARLVRYIQRRFDLDTAGNTILIKTDAQYGQADAFYEAKGRYNLFFTCNTWANEGLKACGQTACVWTPFYKGIFYHYDKPLRQHAPGR